MSNGAGNGELVQALLNILGEMRTLRVQYEQRLAEHEQRMVGWQAEHDQRMADFADHIAEHDERMGEWGALMLRINAELRELEDRQAQAREDQRVLSAEIQALRGRVDVVEKKVG